MSVPSAPEGPMRMPSVSRPTRRPSQSNPSGASVVRRPSRAGHQLPVPHKPLSHQEALEALRSFLKERSSYDVFPVSFRLIVLDSQLKVKKALDVMLLYDIERELQVPPPPLVSVHPLRPLFDACKCLIETHARRLPLIDRDSQTDGEVVISVLTQYRVLKFIAMNYLTYGVRELGIGTYIENPTAEKPFGKIATATMKTTVFDVVHMFSELGISAVPIVDDDGKVIDLYETVDVISLDFTIEQALKQRAPDFEGVVTCHPKDSLGAIFSLIKVRRVHRLVVVSGEDDPHPGRLVGVISLSDIMRHLINETPTASSGLAPPQESAESQETPPNEAAGDDKQ
ncbi:snf1p protein kinase activator, Snf4p [Trichosporon asahii var. asahii CBS 8904]|uniref:Snf1p protein kinase activator, Snf4p n=2 Tax=Trichosporon asahii var. asahii TaxID=189963 RepID=K1VT43_TRIAC|nr:snf1p protein kinase activator, Snf4p [Trichosporon asahii var. asahii CBS 2479]EJT45852.1 snf1p protein kinase activator, Snf4p [Trichosporon asahii var. asahii CBS 2479]EKC99852.1 snf1p protein kinase activator, Snf4p [Trichosporon asahii var. asahii CBS 8904]